MKDRFMEDFSVSVENILKRFEIKRKGERFL